MMLTMMMRIMITMVIPSGLDDNNDDVADLDGYFLQACFRLDSTSEDGRELLVPSGEKTNYFEKVSLNLLPFTTDYFDY